MAEMSLREQAQEIMRIAEESGVQGNFFFVTTFDRYITQLETLKKLKASLTDEDILVTKEYVKGRKNLYPNPAIKEYNSTTDSANKTVSTLMKILKNFASDDGDKIEEDPLMQIINGGGLSE